MRHRGAESGCAQVGRGEAVGAVWALTGGQHDTTALCVRDSEFVRMSRVRACSQRPPRSAPLLRRAAWRLSDARDWCCAVSGSAHHGAGSRCWCLL